MWRGKITLTERPLNFSRNEVIRKRSWQAGYFVMDANDQRETESGVRERHCNIIAGIPHPLPPGLESSPRQIKAGGVGGDVPLPRKRKRKQSVSKIGRKVT